MGENGNLKHPIYLINQTTGTPISSPLRNVLLLHRWGNYGFILDSINVGMEETRIEFNFLNNKDQICFGEVHSSSSSGPIKSTGMLSCQKQPQVKEGWTVQAKGPKLFNRSCFPRYYCEVTGMVLCMEIQGWDNELPSREWQWHREESKWCWNWNGTVLDRDFPPAHSSASRCGAEWDQYRAQVFSRTDFFFFSVNTENISANRVRFLFW